MSVQPVWTDDEFARKLGDAISFYPENFWKSGKDEYVSLSSLRAGAENITVTLTKDQWDMIIYGLDNLDNSQKRK